MIVGLLVFVALMISVAEANNHPPPEALPWDSVIFIDTIQVKGGIVVDSSWLFYITKAHYEIFLYGDDYKDIQATREQLRQIEVLLERRKKRSD